MPQGKEGTLMREIKLLMVCEGEGTPVRVSSPQYAFEVIKGEFMSLDREAFYTFPLSARNDIIGKHLVSLGSLSGSVVHPREVFKVPVLSTDDEGTEDCKQEVYRVAIRANAAAVLLAHNHPSGDPTPSQEDIQITKQLVEAGKILGIKVVDHLVVAGDAYYSFMEEGQLDQL